MLQLALFQLDFDLARHVLCAPHLRRHRSSQQGNSGPRTVAQPGTIELVVLGGRTEVPQNRLIILRQKREAAVLVLRPSADVRGGDVAHVVHVEAEQSAHLRFLQQRSGASQALAPQALEIHPIFPIHRHRSVGF